jgi:hypothetical protein
MITILEACRIANAYGLPTSRWEIRKVIAPSMEQANSYGMKGYNAINLFHSYMSQEVWERGADALAVEREQADE